MRTLAILAATLLLSTPAFAQNTNSQKAQQLPQAQQNLPTNMPQISQEPQVAARIAQEIRGNLEQAGFKNIQLMPSSFIVRAEDQNNNTVVMVINPSSVAAINGQASGNPSTDQSTVGQGPGTGTTSNSDNEATQPRR